MLRLERSRYLGTNVHSFSTGGLTISETIYHQKVFEGWHCHENHHITLILKGGNREQRKQEEITASPGAILRYNEGELHRNMHTQHPSRNINLEIEDAFLSRFQLNFSHLQHSPDLKLSLLKIYQESKIAGPSSQTSIEAMLLHLFSNKGSKNRPPWIDQLRNLLHDRWNESLSLQELSTLIDIHPVTISKYFPRYFSCTLGEYMRKLRVEKAVDLMKEEQMSLTELAYHCGFFDQSHFIRAFKTCTGFRPKEYQQL
ncbi:helix-turn-helix domain-containing protein [Chitinophaga sp. SYP-B3965]|uniref:helix-turn-helix domain-containing protein n=1 Tax=Chitinophaga sp. SYP-B3965 TaxID=2663120 RepID=UPI001299F1DF|nr:AraC family transcriptional regulator [Chitinophaga sp. SYP-B3965]MRG45535.1 helix-turn-helix domain-containing protein [Chitinophaga sp. SYP-B3965]